MSFKKHRIIIDNRKYFYWEKNSKEKEILLLLHGFPGSHSGLIAIANGLKGYRIIVPDLPACGLSDLLLKKHNLKNYSEWLNNFLKSLHIKRVTIIGHSFGTRIALVFGEHYHRKVEGMVLITPVVKAEGLIARFVSVEYDIAKILPKYLQKLWLFNPLYRKVENMILFKSVNAKRREELKEGESRELKHLNPRVSIELFEEFYKSSLVPVAKKIKIKTLVIACALDEIAPQSAVQELANGLANSELVVMKNCGHLVVLEKPLSTSSIIRKWLKNNS